MLSIHSIQKLRKQQIITPPPPPIDWRNLRDGKQAVVLPYRRSKRVCQIPVPHIPLAPPLNTSAVLRCRERTGFRVVGDLRMHVRHAIGRCLRAARRSMHDACGVAQPEHTACTAQHGCLPQSTGRAAGLGEEVERDQRN